MRRLAVAIALFCLIFAKTNVKAAPTEKELRDYAFGVALNVGISPHFLTALIETESEFNISATNGNLMQVMPQFQGERLANLGIRNFYDPYQNIVVGADYIRYLFDEYEDPAVVLMIYNEGPCGAVRAEQGDLSYYATKILDRAYELEQIYEYGGDDIHG